MKEKEKENVKAELVAELVRYAREHNYPVYHCEVNKKVNADGDLEAYDKIESPVYDQVISWAFDFLRTDATQHDIFPYGYTLEIFVEEDGNLTNLHYISEV